MVQYDPGVIIQFAESLYLKADKVVRNYIIKGCLLGVAIGLLLALIIENENVEILIALILTVLFGYFGYAVGQSAAFKYKLQAQTALCNVKIEENTRKSV